MSLPYEGEIFEPVKRRFEETIVFVPFFNGKKEQLKRHIEWIVELGFRSAILENSIPNRGFPNPRKLFSKDRQWGVKHVWADEVERFLDLIDGPKIIFAFSGPSACAVEALARREEHLGAVSNGTSGAGSAGDVRALICDSGPFFYDRYCNRNRLFLERGIRNPIALAAMSTIHEKIWSHDHTGTLRNALAKLPQHFPVMSIRPLNDVLVPPWATDAAFREQTHLDLDVFDVPGAAHLKALRDHPEIYKPTVGKFLKAHAKEI